jgi:hypothetical protein
MLYHNFKLELDPKIIGVRDGMTQADIYPKGFVDQARYRDMETFLGYENYWRRERHEPPLSHDLPRSFVIEYAQLRRHAKLTDFLDFGAPFTACPFMLSAQAREVFNNASIQHHYYLSSCIYDQQKALVTEEYQLMYCPFLGYEMIDFGNSRFRTNRSLPAAPHWEYHTFADLTEYEAHNNSRRKMAEVASLVMSDTFDAGLDFFQCKIGGMFMSERLRNAVEAAGLTGVYFPDKTEVLAVAP